MKKKIAALAAALAAVLILAGCETNKIEDKTAAPEKTSRFVQIERTDFGMVVYDLETKVMYAVSNHGIFTLLVDQNGDPLLYGDAQE